MSGCDAHVGRQPSVRHVLTLTPFYPNASEEANGCFISETLSCLEHAGIKNTVLAVRPVYRGRVRESVSAPPARWLHYLAPPSGTGLAISGTCLYARLLPVVRRLHAEQPIELIHAHAALPCGHAAALLSREMQIPFVVSVHGLDAYSTKQVKGFAGRSCERVSQMVYRSARRVICISKRVREEVENRLPGPIPCIVVYNGVDPGMFFPPEHWVQGESIVLTIGNLISTKGHELLLRAIAKLGDKYSPLRCEIIGEGPDRTRLGALAEQLRIADRVVFLGRQPRKKVADALRRCTIFALLSHYEGLGCVYLEAMATGKPALGCRGEGIGEIIRSGENGWLVGSGNEQEATQALAALLEDATLRARLGNAARRTILDGFTLAHQAVQLARVYRECVG